MVTARRREGGREGRGKKNDLSLMKGGGKRKRKRKTSGLASAGQPSYFACHDRGKGKRKGKEEKKKAREERESVFDVVRGLHLCCPSLGKKGRKLEEKERRGGGKKKSWRESKKNPSYF